jgi:flagellar protein FliJ
MKRFAFRLEKVLDYRSYRQIAALKALLDAKRARAERRRAMARTFEKKADIASACDEEGGQGMFVPRYHIYQTFLMTLDDQLNEIVLEIRADDKRVKQKEMFLKKETVRRKTLDLLKELKELEYYNTMEKEEQKLLDELVILRRRQNK